MKILRWIAVAIALPAAILAPSAPAIREVWPHLGHYPAAGVPLLPFALAGYADATEDIRNNELLLRAWGCRGPDRRYADLLWQRYRVRLLPGGWTSMRRDARWTGYNAAMTSEIERRFGTGILRSVYEEARRREQIIDP